MPLTFVLIPDMKITENLLEEEEEAAAKRIRHHSDVRGVRHHPDVSHDVALLSAAREVVWNDTHTHTHTHTLSLSLALSLSLFFLSRSFLYTHTHTHTHTHYDIHGRGEGGYWERDGGGESRERVGGDRMERRAQKAPS